jgi:hypothetical protein
MFQARLGRLNVELKLIAEEFVELLRDSPRQTTTSPEGTVPPPTVVPPTAVPAGGS